MRIRVQIALVTSIVFIVLFSILSYTGQQIYTYNSIRLDVEAAYRELDKIVNIVRYEGITLVSGVRAAAQWNATSLFLQGRNPGFVEKQLDKAALTQLDVEAMVVLDAAGRVFHYVSVEGFGHDEALRSLLSGGWLAAEVTANSSLAGLLVLDDEVAIVAASPILAGGGQAQPLGAMIMVHTLSSQTQVRISSLLMYVVEIAPFHPSRAEGSIRVDESSYFRLLDEASLSALRVLPDVRGVPSVAVEATLPRDVSQVGRSALQLFQISLVGITLAMAVTVIAIYDSIFARRLSKLSGDIWRVDIETETIPKIIEGGNDEIGLLASNINKLLDAMDRLRERLRQAERMAAIGETSTMVGHDLRNPLQTIMNTVYIIRRSLATQNLDPAEMERLQKLLGILEDQSSYMNKTISDIQDYARNIRLKVVDVEVSILIERALALVAVPGQVEVRVDVEPGLMVAVDPVLLNRALNNIILNAVQAMSKGGVLGIKARRSGGSVKIAISDTGTGISAEALPNLFKPFFTTKAKGVGLGLAVSKRFVELLGGRIDVESKEGSGTTFTVTLPAPARAGL